ncbi:MAG: MipA/OmpV family protein [Rhodospirillaceae bacterium]|nr:MipA/OmpV family protein [Rhodospirillaceae bacterium]
MTLRQRLFGPLTAAAVIAASATAALAQPFETSTSWLQGFDDWISEIGAMKATDFQFSLGTGVGLTTDYPGSDRYKAVALPLFQVRYKDKLTVDPLGIRFRVWRNSCCRARLVIGLSESRGADMASPVSRLPDVDRGMNVGFIFEGRIAGPLAFRFNARQEVAGGHSGMTLSPALGVVLRDKAQTYSVIPELALTWASSDYMDSFFSVTPMGAAVSGLRAFNATPGLRDVSLRLTATRKISEDWMVVGRLQGSKLLGDAKRSSITQQTGDSFQGIAGFGFMYTF